MWVNAHYIGVADSFEKQIEYILNCFADFIGSPKAYREIRQKGDGFSDSWCYEIDGFVWKFTDILFILRYNGDINPKWLIDWQNFDKTGDFYCDLWWYMKEAQKLGENYSMKKVVEALYGHTIQYQTMQINKASREMLNSFGGRVVQTASKIGKKMKNVCVSLRKQYNKCIKFLIIK